ncbi:methyltransferase domain-containing protein [Salinarimonas ramus]|uniref:DUF4214 domain-containing protein n=1 Tax=Salinarimonas ramus TaxID=690164 RepID=A0A917QEL1_9HYPH|nr:methyltransferase domain-containing protein [Salinarimonas ramus]GGK47121.1 hypothetical protein GCM10011322_37710 [Salinarimonas ramus]
MRGADRSGLELGKSMATIDHIISRIDEAVRASGEVARTGADPKEPLPKVEVEVDAAPTGRSAPQMLHFARAGGEMARLASEASARAGHFRIRELELLDDEAFVAFAYRTVLGRDPDPAGCNELISRMREGRLSRSEVLRTLARSEEGVEAGRGIDGGVRGRLVSLIRHLPFADRLVRRVVRYRRLFRHVKQLETRLVDDAAHRRQVDTDLGRLATELFALRELVDRDATSSISRDAYLAAATNRTFGVVERRIANVEWQHRDLERRDDAARAERQSFQQHLETIQAIRAVVEAQARSVRGLMQDYERALSGVQDAARLPGGRGDADAAHSSSITATQVDDVLYLAFEDRFRGSRREIVDRQRRYLPLLRSLDPVRDAGIVLDVGCGRGEWLTLLGDAGIRARGIDMNAVMVEETKAAGGDAICGDALAYLREAQPGSYAAITAFHVVEHLDFALLVEFLASCKRALAPGGAILFETPNPENLVVGACTFHLDPTHLKPLPPALLAFLVEAGGFERTRVIRTVDDLDLSVPEGGFHPSDVGDWFRVPPDYAVFAVAGSSGS